MRWVFVLSLLAGCDKVFLTGEAPPPVDADERTPECPGEFGPNRYVVFSQKVNWRAAQDACAALIGVRMYSHLAIVTDVPEAQVVIDLVTKDNLKNEAWVGLSDFQDSTLFRWITTEPVVAIPWLPGQPNLSPRQVGRCGRVLRDDDDGPGLADTPCDEAKLVLCECDEFPIDPERF